MYQIHSTSWLFVGIFICIAIFIAFCVLAQYKKIKNPKYLPFLPFGLALLQMLALGGISTYDDAHLRSEIKKINPLSVSNLVLVTSGHKYIIKTNQINILLNQLQQVEAIPAHHSHTINSFEIRFMLNKNIYQFRVGRDSDRTDEYWMFETARTLYGHEIGRIQSSNMSQVLNSLAQ